MESVEVISHDSFPHFSRRIEQMSKPNVIRTLCLLLISLVLICIIYFISPKFLTTSTNVVPITEIDSVNRIIRITLDKFSFLNRFLVLSMGFLRESASNSVNVSFSSSCQIRAFRQKKMSYFTESNENEITLSFSNESEKTNAFRFHTSHFIDFDKLEIVFFLHFAKKQTFPMEFTYQTANIAHTLICLSIRSNFCFLSILILVQVFLHPIPISKHNSSMMLAIILLVCLIISSNPLILFEYYNNSIFIRLLDSMVSKLLIIVCCYVGLIHLYLGDSKDETRPLSFYLSTIFPFGIVYCIICFQSYNASSLITKDPIIHPNSAFRGFAILKYVLLSAYLPMILIIGLKQRSSVKFDQMIHTILAFFYAAAVLFFELISPKEEILGTSLELQIYSFVSGAIFTFFFTYLNWPVEEGLVDEENEAKMGEVLEVDELVSE